MWDGHDNTMTTLSMEYGDVGSALAAAAHVVEMDLEVGRHSAVPLETRSLVVEPRADGALTIWGWTKVAHFNRELLARLLGVKSTTITLRSCDAGGGFGARGILPRGLPHSLPGPQTGLRRQVDRGPG